MPRLEKKRGIGRRVPILVNDRSSPKLSMLFSSFDNFDPRQRGCKVKHRRGTFFRWKAIAIGLVCKTRLRLPQGAAAGTSSLKPPGQITEMRPLDAPSSTYSPKRPI